MERTKLNWGIWFLFAANAVAQQATPESDQLAVLEGNVVNALTKEPVRKAHVALSPSDRANGNVFVAAADESGHFRFSIIEAGRYWLTAHKGGFLNGNYGSNKPNGQGSLLAVNAGDRIADLTLRLFPAASVSGRVLDQDGDPVPGETVAIYRTVQAHGQRKISYSDRVNTNRSGEYHFDGLLPSTYFVGTRVENRGFAVGQVPVDDSGIAINRHELSTLYPAAPTLEDAQAVSVESGQEQMGIDIRIQLGPLLSVKGRIAGTGGSSSQFSLFATVGNGMGGWTSGIGTILPNGDFLVAGLPPGKHRLKLSEAGVKGSRIVGRTDVDLTDQDVTGVVITPFRPAQVRMRGVVEGEEDKPFTQGSGSVFLTSAEGPDDSGLMQFQPQNGIYIIDGVSPGNYKIWFNNAPDCYLKSVKSGGRVLDPDSIDVGEGATLELLMIFSRNVASLAGDVEVSQDQSNQDQSNQQIHVQLISDEVSPDFGGFVRAVLDQSRHFSLPNVRPGKYLAFATQEEDSDVWENADFVRLLKSQGTAVELHEKEKATIHLKLIGKDETDRIRKQLGL